MSNDKQTMNPSGLSKVKNDDASEDVIKRSKPASNETDEVQSDPKRAKTNDNGDSHLSNNQTVFDGAYVYGLNAGDRLLVRWEIIENEGKENECTIERWWGATLLEYDGRTYIEENDDDNQNSSDGNNDDAGPVAVRVLEYDEYPESGFNEKTREDVVFASSGELLDLKSLDVLPYKRVDEDTMIDIFSQDNASGLEDIVNTVLSNAMKKSLPNFDSLPASVKLKVAEKISVKREKLLQLMEEFFAKSGKRGGTSEDMKALIAQTMRDD
jgi:hypothetical protein